MILDVVVFRSSTAVRTAVLRVWHHALPMNCNVDRFEQVKKQKTVLVNGDGNVPRFSCVYRQYTVMMQF